MNGDYDYILKQNGFEAIVQMHEDVFWVHESKEEYKTMMRKWAKEDRRIHGVVKQYLKVFEWTRENYCEDKFFPQSVWKQDKNQIEYT